VKRAWLVIWLLSALGCAELDSPDEDPWDPRLRPVALTPSPQDGPIARDATFTLSFNAYLNPDPLTYYNVFVLSSGGLRAGGSAEYHMVDRALVFTTTRAMTPDLYWTLAWDPEVLQTLTGQPLDGPLGATFVVEDRLEDRPAPAPPTTWQDIAPILAPCGACHDDPAWRLPPITPEALINQPSAQRTGRVLVRPFDPTRSYLLHKLLPDFPSRDGEAQPPAWAEDAAPLSREELRLIERWIRGGAAVTPPGP
jgi:hypothetical protein